uniref:Uncharacterized protein n=1 Tax=Ditylenchus dipsaci TaxID=166011 RepID=A0A915CQV9_9BILA
MGSLSAGLLFIHSFWWTSVYRRAISLEFKKLEEILLNLKENVNGKLLEKEEYISSLEYQIHKLTLELEELRKENQHLQNIYSITEKNSNLSIKSRQD